MKKLLNAAMMPEAGTYKLTRISREEFVDLVREGVESFIGYIDTAKFISDLAGVEIPVNRSLTVLDPQDEMLIIKLKYRVPNPTDKGKFTPGPDDWEFFVCSYSAD